LTDHWTRKRIRGSQENENTKKEGKDDSMDASHTLMDCKYQTHRKRKQK